MEEFPVCEFEEHNYELMNFNWDFSLLEIYYADFVNYLFQGHILLSLKLNHFQITICEYVVFNSRLNLVDNLDAKV